MRLYYDEPDTPKRSNEEWRNDPVRRANCREICRQLAEYHATVADGLALASEAISKIQRAGDLDFFRYDPLKYAAVIGAQAYAARQADFYSNPTETYIGNMAAFGQGELK